VQAADAQRGCRVEGGPLGRAPLRAVDRAEGGLPGGVVGVEAEPR
jgi:hypothetical protein